MLRQRAAPSFVASPFDVEPLEVRRLLAASVVDGVLYVDGTDAGEQITVRSTVSEDGATAELAVAVGGEQAAFVATDVHRIVVRAGDGDDTVQVAVRRPDPGKPAHAVSRVLVEGGDGNDRLEAETPFGGTLLGGTGDDSVVGGVYRDALRGGAGRDWLEGGDGRDQLWGGDGNDRVDGGRDEDRVRGGSGRDEFLNSDSRAERLDFGAGDSLRRIFAAGPHVFVRDGVLHFIGSEGREGVLLRQALTPPQPSPMLGPQLVTGFYYTFVLDGNRHMTGSFRTGDVTAVRIDLRGGDDTVNLANRSEQPNLEPNPETGGAALTVPATVLAGDGNDVIYGGEAADVISGGEGDDRLAGGGGTDELRGDGGRDTFLSAWDSPAEMLDREADEPL
jgi:Ca2+-binding RTX toxin-like protein